MRRSGSTWKMLAALPVLAVAAPAAATILTAEQVGGTAGSMALGAVGGPVAGLVGGVAGRLFVHMVQHRRSPLDPHLPPAPRQVQPIADRRPIDPPADQPVVDLTPVRYVPKLPPDNPFAAGREASARAAQMQRVVSQGAPSADLPDDPNASPGTLDYQVNQLKARGAWQGGAGLTPIADRRVTPAD